MNRCLLTGTAVLLSAFALRAQKQGDLAEAPAFEIDGTVRADVGLKTFPPLGGVKVYLQLRKDDIIVPMKAGGMPYPYTYRTVDSTATDARGYYRFAGVPEGIYRLGLVKQGYQSKYGSGTHWGGGAFRLKKDTTINETLLPEDASASVAGNVSWADCPEGPLKGAPCVLRPLAGCTLTVASNVIVPYPAGSYGPDGPEGAQAAGHVAVTGEDGNYIIEDVPVTYSNQPVQVTARTEEFATAVQSAALRNQNRATVNFLLEKSYSNSGSTVKDGMVFTVATEKSLYYPGERPRVRYTVTNGSNRTATYNFSTTCQFDMTVRDSAGDTVHHYMQGRGCGEALTSIVLQPGESDTMDFPVFFMPSAEGVYSVSAWMIGYREQSRAEVRMEVRPRFTGVKAPPRSAPALPEAAFGGRGRVVVLDLARAGEVSMEAFTLDGRAVAQLTFSRHFSAGRHEIVAGDAVKAGAIVLRVRGEGFSLTRLFRKNGR